MGPGWSHHSRSRTCQSWRGLLARVDKMQLGWVGVGCNREHDRSVGASGFLRLYLGHEKQLEACLIIHLENPSSLRAGKHLRMQNVCPRSSSETD